MKQKSAISKPLTAIENDLERAVFLSNYYSSKQKYRRLKAKGLLSIKHGLRGLLFSWPLYLLPLSVLALPENFKFLFVLFLIPGLFVSAMILQKGIQEDYQDMVKDRLLECGYLSQIFFKKNLPNN